MPRGKQFDIAEKATIKAWFYENVAPKGIATRLKRDITAVQKIIRDNKTLLPSATLLSPRKQTRRPSLSFFRQPERLSQYVLRFPFKTGRKLKAEVQVWQHVCEDDSEGVQAKVGPAIPLRSKEAFADSQDGEEEDSILQTTPFVD
jgi:hypothetical protein